MEYEPQMRNKLGLYIGAGVFALLLILPPPEGMHPAGMKAAAVSLLMAIFWITEAIPISPYCIADTWSILCGACNRSK